MNYFERLARRARMQPARRPGEALRDPFEDIDAWPLEHVAQALAAHDVQATENALPGGDAVRTLLEHATHVTERIRDAATPAVATSLTNTVPDEAGTSSRAEEQAFSTKRIVTADARAQDAAPASSLDQADRFMRALGVPLPAEPLEQCADRNVAPSSDTREPARDTSRTSTPQAISPPAPPLPALAEVSVNPATPESTATTTHPQAQLPAQRAAAPPLVETQRVLVVERATARRDLDEPAAGRGSARFGLGQM